MKKPLRLSLFLSVLMASGYFCQLLFPARATEPAFAIVAQPPGKAAGVQVAEAYARLPLNFEENKGQTDSRVKFLSRGPGYNLFLTRAGALISLELPGGERAKASLSSPKGRAKRTVSLRMRLVGASDGAGISGVSELPGKSNYFIGDDPRAWRTGINTYAQVLYAGIYPGVDMLFYGTRRQLEYDFRIAPGADPSLIKVGFEGADRLKIDEQGNLSVNIAGQKVWHHKPVIYQEDEGGLRREVEGGYVLLGMNRVGFRVGDYDTARPLIIDPVLTYSTHLGGSGADAGEGIAVDASGNAYVTGTTASADFPTTGGSFQTHSNDNISDVFVTKLNAAGTALLYSTYVGGRDADVGHGIDVDAAGNAYVTGSTGGAFTSNTGNFPLVNAYDSTFGGTDDAFLFKLDPNGSALLFSTYLGGSSSEVGWDVAVDKTTSEAYVAGYTGSSNFPVSDSALRTQFGAGDSSNAFVTKFNTQGSALVYSTYVGGNSGADVIYDIALDGGGNAYVAGETNSAFFPATAGAFQTTCTGCNLGRSDAFVAKINPQGTAFAYATYLGGSLPDGAKGVAVDAAGAAYVTGYAHSGSDSTKPFPTTPGTFQPTSPAGIGFVAKLSPDGTALVYSSFLGAEGRSIAVDSSGNAYLTGQTLRSDYPMVNPISSAFTPGVRHIVVTVLNGDASALTFSTYFGQGSGNRIVLDGRGEAYMTGETLNDALPTTNAIQPVRGGSGTNTSSSSDAFVTKINFANSGNSTPAVSINDVSILEGDADTSPMTFTVTLSAASSQTVTVDYTVLSGTAGGALDFQPVKGTLQFLPGITTNTITVPVIGDLIDEPDETFSVHLSNPTNGAIIEKAEGVCTIVDNDPMPSISISDVSLPEGDSGTSSANFTVSLSAASGKTITVDYSTSDGTAIAGSDYAASSGILSFAPGELTKAVTVLVNGDATDEQRDEVFALSLTNPWNASLSRASGAATIVNDDAPIVQLASSSYTINEGAANTAQGFASLSVEAVRTGDKSASATVRYFTSDQSGGLECDAVTGFASQRCDYTTQAGTLRFAAGEATKTISIPVINDGYQEGNEVFSITLQNPTGATLGTTTQATITISDDAADSTPTTGANNPYLSNGFFVRMNYLDFLTREPDASGFNDWTNVLNNCGSQRGFLGAPFDCDRAHVSHGFFGSPEFTNRGFLIYRLYEVGMNRLPRYSEFTPDMASLSGFGLSDAVQQQNLSDYLQQFTSRTEFTNRFSDSLLPSQAATLIQKLEQTAGVTLPATATTLPGQPTQYGRQELINLRANGTFTVGQVVKAFVEQQLVYDKYFPRAQVTMLYFAYLKRDPDLNDPNLLGWNEWVFVFTNGGAQRGRPDIAPRDIQHLIFGFIYSEEYRKRFGTP